MTIIRGSIMSLIILVSFFSNGQEIRKKKELKKDTFRTFVVTKEDKSIKHGAYYSYAQNGLSKILYEFGYHDMNQRAGKWINFYSRVTSPVFSISEYKSGVRSGRYREFHLPQRNSSLSQVFGLEVYAQILETKKEIALQGDTSSLQLMTEGVIENNNKVGTWKFYSPTGQVIQTYNYETQKIEVNNMLDERDDPYVYIGSQLRFMSIYHGNNGPLIKFPMENDGVTRIKITSSGYEVLSIEGNPDFAEYVLEKLESIPFEWVPNNNTSTDQLVFEAILKIFGNRIGISDKFILLPKSP